MKICYLSLLLLNYKLQVFNYLELFHHWKDIFKISGTWPNKTKYNNCDFLGQNVEILQQPECTVWHQINIHFCWWVMYSTLGGAWFWLIRFVIRTNMAPTVSNSRHATIESRVIFDQCSLEFDLNLVSSHSLLLIEWRALPLGLIFVLLVSVGIAVQSYVVWTTALEPAKVCEMTWNGSPGRPLMANEQGALGTGSMHGNLPLFIWIYFSYCKNPNLVKNK